MARGKHLIERLRVRATLTKSNYSLSFDNLSFSQDSWQHLLRDRATRSLTYNDEQFHALEKIKIAETGKRMKLLLTDDVRPVVAQIAECLADWYKRAQTIYLKVNRRNYIIPCGEVIHDSPVVDTNTRKGH